MSGNASPKAPADCTHEEFHADVKVARLMDCGKFMAEVRVRCVECGEPFRFVGVDAGLAFDRPLVSVDGLELRAPIEPELEAQLHARASYQMPVIPVRN